MSEEIEKPSTNDDAKYVLRLEKDLLEKSKALAKKRGMSLAALLRSYLISELETEEKKS